jgi:hypothetical protein
MIVLAYFGSQCTKFHIAGYTLLNFYVLLFEVVYLMRFRDGSDSECASNVAQISGKVRRRPWQWLDKLSGKKAGAVHGKSKLTVTGKSETGEKKSQAHAHHFHWHQRDCSQRILPDRPHSKFRILLWRFTATAWKCVKTSPRTLASTELAVASRQRTASHFLFHQGLFDEKQHDYGPPTLPSFLFFLDRR